MVWTHHKQRISTALVLVALSAFVLVGLSSFGIWDPWELSVADLAREVAAGTGTIDNRPPLSVWLIAQGFSLFGIHEWSGRLPIALAGLGTLALTYVTAARFVDRRSGVWATVAVGTSPLFLFNARQMFGAAPAFLASAGVFLCAMAAIYAPAAPDAPAPVRNRVRALWLVGAAVSSVAAVLTSGALTGLVPPLLAAGATVVARGELLRGRASRVRDLAAALVVGAGIAAAVVTAHAVWADFAGFKLSTGGVPRGGDPPTWEVAIERVFHSFAPWSAILPLALAAMLTQANVGPRVGDENESADANERESALRIGLVMWAAFGFLAQALYSARFGPATFLPIVAAGVAVGVFLRDAEQTPRSLGATAVVVFLFVGLLVRDFGAYPGGPIEGIMVEGIEVPDAATTAQLARAETDAGLDPVGWLRALDPRLAWASVLGLFGLLAALGLGSAPAAAGESPLRAAIQRFRDASTRERFALLLATGFPVTLVANQWRRRGGYRVWTVVAAVLLTATLVVGLVCWLLPGALSEAGLTSLDIKTGRILVFLPIGLFVAVAVARAAFTAFGSLGHNRLVPALLGALLTGAYVTFGFAPGLSAHFSPREVYDTYAELARPGEPLGEFRVGGRAAAYYASGNDIRELSSQSELVRFLQSEARVWAAFRADDLAAIDREYRREAGQHLFVADARSTRMLLATNQPVDGRENANYLAEVVLDEAPRPQHRVHINFDNRITLLGYDLEGSHSRETVGPGSTFSITWYLRVEAPVPGGYRPFVHIDGPGQRINGDHDPVEGRYPMRLWEAGDIIADRHEMRVPANYRRGDLTIYMGYYSGDSRLEILEGPEDDVNRARVGNLQIR